MAQAFDVASWPGRGTAVFARLLRDEGRASDASDDIAAIAVPKAGEEVSGDAWATRRDAAGCTLFMVDGIGHGSGERRLTTDGGWPVWWPDGRQLAYLTLGPQGNQVRVVSLDGATRLLGSIKLEGSNHPFALFPDGKRIAGTNAVHVSDEIWLLEPRK